jgi:hypothetical protein
LFDRYGKLGNLIRKRETEYLAIYVKDPEADKGIRKPARERKIRKPARE